MMSQTTVMQELEEIRNGHGGILRPRDVVEYAKDPGTALHDKFDWNDESAGDKYRLWQAREIIQVMVKVLPGCDKPIRTYISLSADRIAGGGYRPIRAVLRNRNMREALLTEAYADMRRFAEKYERLSEVAEVVRVICRRLAAKKG